MRGKECQEVSKQTNKVIIVVIIIITIIIIISLTQICVATESEKCKVQICRNSNSFSILYNSIQFNSILYYLCAEPTATRPITDTAHCR
jgi:hypothetical protein